MSGRPSAESISRIKFGSIFRDSKQCLSADRSKLISGVPSPTTVGFPGIKSRPSVKNSPSIGDSGEKSSEKLETMVGLTAGSIFQGV